MRVLADKRYINMRLLIYIYINICIINVECIPHVILCCCDVIY